MVTDLVVRFIGSVRPPFVDPTRKMTDYSSLEPVDPEEEGWVDVPMDEVDVAMVSGEL